MNAAVLYYTDNSLDSRLSKVVQSYLVKAVGELRIVSVSQQPINFGENICVGEIGRSLESIRRQVIVGLITINQEAVYLVEHDVIYPASHFKFVLELLNDYWCWCNENVIYGDVKRGVYFLTEYSAKRTPLSQMVVKRNSMLDWLANESNPLEPPCRKHRDTETSIDLRHKTNFSSKGRITRKRHNFDESHGWGSLPGVLACNCL